MVKWLFFDLGSTLVDESACEEYRIQELLKHANAPGREILENKMKEYASKNRQAYKETAAEFGMHTIWVKQGLGAYEDLSLINHKTDVIMEHIEDMLEYL